MTTPKQNRKIVQAILTIAAIVAAVFIGRWYLGDGKTSTAQHEQPEQKIPSVVINIVSKADLALAREYVGRVESIQTVELRPQITGEIAQVHFKEGSAVKAGQLLFTIDDKQFQATVALRKADLAKAEANNDRAVRYFSRLEAADKRSVSDSDLDTARNDVLQSKAAIEQAKASLRLAQIDLGYTKITAPISGQIGKAAFTKGNYVTPAAALASIVQLDPIRVAFSLPDKDYMEQLQALKAPGNSVYDVTLRFADGSVYPLRGARDFEDNMMDQKTGTMMMRFRFKNDKSMLIPGSMVRVAARPVKSRISVVIPQEAILADMQGDFVYQVDESNVAHQRRVKLGEEAGTMREVLSGIEEGEKLIVRGLQHVRPERAVNPMLQDTSGTKTPAELAMESVHDITPISNDASGASMGGKPAEGNR